MTDIVERWQGIEIDDPEAVEALKTVEEETPEVEEEAEEQGINDAEFAVYTDLTEETSEFIESDEQTESVSKEIIRPAPE